MVTVKDFYAEWCGPCDQQDEIIEDLEADLAERDDIDIETFDVDDNQDEANKYQVRSLPAIVVLTDDGSVVERFNGVTARDQIEGAIEDAGVAV